MKATENNIKIGTKLQKENEPQWGNWIVSKIKMFEGSKLIEVDHEDGSPGTMFDNFNWIII